ncbi:MAG: hypothetical protein KDJ52_20210 [Anaerolineae bacterium]|nr:hypothetical protein [Anaerolineae bacterium]
MTDETNIGGVNISDIHSGTIQTGNISTTITAGGDVVGRDKIVNEITHIVNQALSAAEEAAKVHEFATKKLAEGVQDYLQRLQAVVEAEGDNRGNPYKGLLAYRLCDAHRFFGRNRAITELLDQLQRSPLTILHAESGAGKSSLLQAGIGNRLLGQGHLPVYLRSYDQSPTLAIKRAFLPNLTGTPELAQAPLRDFLQQVTSVLGTGTTLYVMLDQFEELFTLIDDATRSKFVAELADCLEDAGLRVVWIVALRTEFFGNLANFRPRIRNPFENDYRLNRLTLAEAETVIIEPAARQDIRFEAELVETLLADLRDPDSGEVAPPQIQLVCSALYAMLQEQQAANPDLPSTLTLQMYDEKSRAEGILRGHLNRVLQRTLSPQEREAARHLLIALVSSDQRRIRRTKSELTVILATYLTAVMSLDALLDQLVENRLVNVEEDEQQDEPAYELAHDYLLTEIEIDPEIQARKAAEELLKQEVEVFKHTGTLLSGDRFDIINSQRQYLHVDEEAAELLRLSQAARRRAQLRRIAAIGMAVLLIVGAAVVITIISRNAAERQAISASTAEAGKATAQIAATKALNAESTAQAEAINAINAQETAQAQAQEAETQATRANLTQQQVIAVQSEFLLNSNPQLALLLAAELAKSGITNEIQQVFGKAPYIFPPIEATLMEHTKVVRDAAWRPDGRYLASGGDDNTIIIWDTDPFKPVRKLTGHSDWVRKIVWHPTNDTQLASASDDGTIKIWDWDREQVVETLNGHQTYILSLASNSDGSLLASGDDDGLIILWDMSQSPPTSTKLAGHTNQVWDLAFSPDDTQLASVSGDETLILWNLITTTPISNVLHGHKDVVRGVAWNPIIGTNQLATAADDRDIIIWDAERGEPIRRLEGHADPVFDLAWSHDGQRLASASTDESVGVWDVATGKLERKLLGHTDYVQGIAFSPDGTQLASTSTDKSIIIWELNWHPALTLDKHSASVFSAVWSPDSARLATTSFDERVIIWAGSPLTPTKILTGHQELVIEADWNAKGDKLASVSADKSIIIWDGASGEPLARLADQPGEYWSVSWHPTQDILAAGLTNNLIQIWDVTSLTQTMLITRQVHTSPSYRAAVLDVAWSPDGRYLASGGDDSRLVILDATDNYTTAYTFEGHENNIFAVEWSPDGRYLASGDRTGLLAVRDTQTPNWDLAYTRTDHTGIILDIAFNGDGSLLASASGGNDELEPDNKIIIWETATGRRINTLMGHTHWIWDVEWSPDGSYLTSASDDQTVKLVDTRFVDAPCRRLSRNLTFEEWDVYFPNQPYQRTCDNFPVPPSVVEAGRDLARQGDWVEAEKIFTHLLALGDATLPFSDAHAEAQRALFEAVAKLQAEGRQLAQNGQVDDAAKKFEEVAEIMRQVGSASPTEMLSPMKTARLFAQPTITNALNVAVELARAGNDVAAKTQFEKAMELAGGLDSEAVWHALCVTGGRWQQAEVVEAACDKAIEFDPKNGQYYNSRGIVRVQLGDMAGARKDFEKFEKWAQGKLLEP